MSVALPHPTTILSTSDVLSGEWRGFWTPCTSDQGAPLFKAETARPTAKQHSLMASVRKRSLVAMLVPWQHVVQKEGRESYGTVQANAPCCGCRWRRSGS